VNWLFNLIWEFLFKLSISYFSLLKAFYVILVPAIHVSVEYSANMDFQHSMYTTRVY